MKRSTARRWRDLLGAGPAVLALAFCLGWGETPVRAQDLPPRPRVSVNDYAGVIRPEDRAALEALNREVLEKSGVAIVVVTVKDLGGFPIEDFANRLGRAWGIGSRENDRGILLLVDVKGKRVRIETGYGVEGYLPDGRVGGLLDRYVIPHFKENDISQGIRRGNEALAALTAEEFGFRITGGPRGGPDRGGRAGRGSRPGGILGGLFSLLFLAVFIVFAVRHPFLALFLLSAMGGGRGRGGFGAGGFGGGGFGGFGGGSFGGGGASRGW